MTEPHVHSINKGGGRHPERGPKNLIEVEWKLIDELLNMAQNARNDRLRAFYYQTLASHIRTLSTLLKLHGTQDQTQDLATLLSEIKTRAQKLAKRLKPIERRTHPTN
jgi:hypothetical protein